MAFQQPVRVFANVPKQPSIQPSTVQNYHFSSPAMEMPLMDENIGVSVSAASRKITVSAVGEATAPPDRCRITIRVVSRKQNLSEAKNSVSRRLDYVVQTLQNHAVKEKDMPVHRIITKLSDSLIQMVAEVRVTFTDFEKCEKISNLLMEKLDGNVSVTLPDFFYTSTAMETLRKQASLLAIHNAKQKAQEMARFVHLALGRPLYIHEEETKEWLGLREGETTSDEGGSVHDNFQQATITITCRVSAAFQLKPKSKTKVSAR